MVYPVGLVKKVFLRGKALVKRKRSIYNNKTDANYSNHYIFKNHKFNIGYVQMRTLA